MAYLKDEIKAGIIIISSLLMLSGFVILIGGGQFWEKPDIYYVKLKNVSGLEQGSQVRLGGVRIGKISSIKEPESAGEPVLLTLGIKKGTPLYKGTKAFISQIGFVGDIFLQLSFADTANERLKTGETIPSEEQVEFTAMMSKLTSLSDSVNNLVSDANKIFSDKNIKNLEQLIGNTDRAIVSGTTNMEKVMASLKKTADTLETVLNEVQDIVKHNKGEFSGLIKKAKEGIEKAGGMIAAIEETAKKADKTLGTADKTLLSVDSTIELQSQNIDALMKTLTKTTEELHEAIQDIRNKPWSVIYKEEGSLREE
jgi:virulence factor Mce-like protein